MFFSRIFTIAASAAAISTIGAMTQPPHHKLHFNAAGARFPFGSGGAAAAAADTVKVLINIQYGGFNFSDEFCAEYDKIYGAGAAYTFISTELYDPAFAGSDCYYNWDISTRYDHKMIEVFERLGGTHACSGKYATLHAIELPRVLAPYITITEYDGAERLRVHITRMYRDLLEEVIARRSVRFIDVLAHEEIRGWENYLKEHDIEFF